MEQAVVEEFLNEVPYEARAAVTELNSDLRWAVYIALVLEGRKYFNEIKEEFKANPNTIGPVLKGLVDGGLVARKIAKFEDFADKRKVFYEPTALGLRLFRVLNDVAIPGGRAPRGSRVAVDAGSAAGTGTGRDTEVRGSYPREPEMTSRSVAEPGIRWRRVGRPRITTSRKASVAGRPREAVRRGRDRRLLRDRV
ncbi:MarR family winged helix-turn-helix transcriptional regulator [Methanoculleus sp. MH98A]|uniref:MarR family winged helix-turn-helix transcriptional regulator n=1 Tax=Methanoculleus sp. MH98A TaxID=1495314 RepID=UPI00049F4FBC|nr:MarR family winged helix-turn-helix transcriptional regulator [Methanoculleus sp. MH98A]KDE54362.1 hypothetical protein EI28_03195 [Methanoculleus sp. MH98A]